MKNTKSSGNNNWQPLRELALHTPYTMGYLSLMARRKQLKVKKIGRIWHSTMENIKEFEDKRRNKKEERKKELSVKYKERTKVNTGKNEAKGTKIKISNPPPAFKLNVSQDTIFDEVQRELEEVLQEIREKEKNLKHKYLIYQKDAERIENDNLVEYRNEFIESEKQETEELSEKLIMDLGKLLNTAKKINEEEISDFSHYKEGNSDKKVSVAIDVLPQKNNLKSPYLAPHSQKSSSQKPRPRLFSDIHVKNSGDQFLSNHDLDNNFLSVPYSSFPFEYDKKRKDSSNYSTQNKILLLIAGVLIFISGVLLVLAIMG